MIFDDSLLISLKTSRQQRVYLMFRLNWTESVIAARAVGC
jgi:hypothetical protein